jgi:hypothetical protein
MIREDLRSQNYFDDQAELNGTSSSYRPHLAKLILTTMKLDDGSDEILQFYFRLIAKRSKEIGEDNTSMMEQVMKVHAALVMEKERRNDNVSE